MWLRRGAAITDELEKLAKETEFAAGYQRVRTPHTAREVLYKKSGHLPYYAESMFPPMEMNEPAPLEDLQRLAKSAESRRQEAAAMKEELGDLLADPAAAKRSEHLQQLQAAIAQGEVQ